MATSFTQKHAPKQLSEIVFPDDDLALEINALATGQWINNILLHGPAGTGKTTLAQLIPKTISPGAGALSITTINGSLDNSINVVRNRINSIARMAPQHGDYNFIIIEEADGLGTGAQRALKGVMDDTKSNTVFIFTTNHDERIEDPIKSRCRVVDMTIKSARRWLPRTREILRVEGLSVPDDIILKNIASAGHDARKILESVERVTLRHRDLK